MTRSRQILIASSVLVAALLLAALVDAGSREIRLELQVRPKLELTGSEKVYIGPFLLEPRGDRARPSRTFDVSEEFERFLHRLVRKHTSLNVLETDRTIRPPVRDSLQLESQTAYWRQLGELTGADLVVTGSIDYQVLDRAGFRTEKYVSPVDGQTYYRQVMVEQTGFSYDVLLMVFETTTGELVYSEQLQDFQQRGADELDDFNGMFSNLFQLEDKLVNLFASRSIQGKRYLFTP